MATIKLKKRNEIDKQYKWAIEDLYSNNEEWQKEYDLVKTLAEDLKKYKGKLGESSDTLIEFLELNDEASKLTERVYVYANQRYHEDTSEPTYQNLSDLAGSLMVSVDSATSFATPEIIEIPDEKLAKFLKENEKLQVYKTYLNNIIRKKAHILSAEIEELLADAGDMADSASNIFSMFNNADIKFPEIEDEDGNTVQITHGKYISLVESSNRKVREAAFKGLYSTYAKFKNTLAATFSSNLKKETYFAKVRKYDSSLAMHLDDSNVPVEVYTNLIEAVHNNLPLMHRYVDLRKRFLKLDEIHMYDLHCPMVADVKMKIDFEKAKEIVADGVKALGGDYQEIIKEGFNNSWIDVYENEGKRSGAYSWGAFGTHPYVLLNYNETLDNVFTLAHEMGHAIHSYKSDKTQPYIYAGYKIFVAEVASTCNEALLMNHLLATTKDKNERAYLLNHYLDQFKSTLYRQTMFAEFEMITHKKLEDGGSLTTEVLCEIYRELNKKYFGETMVVDEEIIMEWARIPHFYTSFYVYQYATGFSAAVALSRRILKEGAPAIEDYLNFLSGGSSKDPIDLLRGAGVDMATQKPINEALAVFKELLDEMEAILE
ncbi:MAG: yjbG [Clostridiales bacterium]|jgi:oligoendopeptidase F|nr:yjbG [Clostridiales bacterium]